MDNSAFIADRLAYVEKCIAASQSHKATVEDKATDRRACIFKVDGDLVVVHTVAVDGLAPDNFKVFSEDVFTVLTKMIEQDKANVKLSVLETIDGRQVLHQRMDPGIVLVSPRSIIFQQYPVPETEGHSFFMSSKASGDLEKKYASLIGSDVIGTLEVNYWSFKPRPGGGTAITHVWCSKPNGNIPDIAMSKMTTKQSNMALHISEYVRAQACH